MMSSTSSMPTDRRTKPSVMPTRSRTSTGMEACVINAGSEIRVSTPPRLSASEQSLTLLRKRRAASSEPRSKASMAPGPRCCLRAMSCVIHFADFRMGVEMTGHGNSIGVVLEHADRERFQAARDEEAVHRSESAACRALDKIDFLGVFGTRQDGGAAGGVAVAVEIFGHGVHDDMRAELDGALEVRAKECVIHDEGDPSVGGKLAKRGEVSDPQGGVRRSLHIKHFGVRAERAEHRLLRRGVDKGEFKAKMHQELRGEAEDSAVNGFGYYSVITGTQKTKDSVNSSHAGREYIRALAAFQFSDGALESFAIRMIGSRVVVTFVFAELGLDIGGSLVDRRDDGTGSGIRFLSHMNRVGGETHYPLLLAAER